MTKKSRFILSPACVFLLFLAANSWLSGNENVSRSPGLESLSPRIAADSVGNFHVVWGECVRDTTRGDAYYAKYDIITQTWTLDNYTVYSRARVNGVWENVQVISAGQSKFCDIAVGSNAVFACWSARHNTPVYQIFYVRRSTSLNAEWTAPRLMYGGSHKQQVPAIEVDSSDIAHIVFTPAFEQAGMRVVRYCRWTGSGFTAPVAISPQMVIHYPALDERAQNLYACWQVGPYGNGTRVDTNNHLNANWTGVNAVPDSAGVTYCDVAVDPLGVDVYYVWDQGGEIWCNMGRTGSAPPDNDPPTAEFEFSPTTGIYPAEITFDASSSEDPDGSIASYSWDFGDGGRDVGMVVRHTYDRWGTFAVRLAVRDNAGATGVKIHNIEILRLFQPLNIRWVTQLDESLLLSRNVAQVTWSKNPANDALGVVITLYRIYRKKADESDAAYLLYGEVTGSVYSFLDTDIGKNNVYVYTVTACDSQGHESPIVGGQGSSTTFERRRASPFPIKRGRLTDRN
jgi:hypothetical protein